MDVNIVLAWDGGDPDINETVYYDVYLGEESNPGFVERIGPYPATQTRITYSNLSKLVYNTRYYWRVDSIDSYGYTTTGPTWVFKTKKAPVLEIKEITGGLGKIKVAVGNTGSADAYRASACRSRGGGSGAGGTGR